MRKYKDQPYIKKKNVKKGIVHEFKWYGLQVNTEWHT